MSVNLKINQEKMGKKGFSLIELLVAMAVASIMMALIVGAYWAQTQAAHDQQMIIGMQQNMRSAMYYLQRDIMMAGYDATPDDTTVEPTIESANDASGNPELRFTYNADEDGIDNNGNGTIDEPDEVETIHYLLFDADADGAADDLRRRPGAPVAGNIEELEFFYTLADGTSTLTPGDPEDVRIVGISMLVRTEDQTRQVNNDVYVSLSGASWGPYNDRVPRQIVKATVKCRNMIEN